MVVFGDFTLFFAIQLFFLIRPFKKKPTCSIRRYMKIIVIDTFFLKSRMKKKSLLVKKL